MKLRSAFKPLDSVAKRLWTLRLMKMNDNMSMKSHVWTDLCWDIEGKCSTEIKRIVVITSRLQPCQSKCTTRTYRKKSALKMRKRDFSENSK